MSLLQKQNRFSRIQLSYYKLENEHVCQRKKMDGLPGLQKSKYVSWAVWKKMEMSGLRLFDLKDKEEHQRVLVLR